MSDKTVLLDIERMCLAAEKDDDFFINGHDILLSGDVMLLCKIARSAMAVMQKVPSVSVKKQTPLAKNLRELREHLDGIEF